MNAQTQLYLIDVDPFEIFMWGADYGQLLMEEERDNEELADAFNGVFVSRKYCMPAAPIERRQAHSQAWRDAKRKGYENLKELIKRINEKNTSARRGFDQNLEAKRTDA